MIESVRNSSYFSDIAIDDVGLLAECINGKLIKVGGMAFKSFSWRQLKACHIKMLLKSISSGSAS